MASESTFDVVSDFDRQELVNAVDQARRDVTTRYDLKDTKTTFDLGEHELVIESDNEMSLRSVREVLETKVLRRNLSLKILDYGNVDEVSGGRVRQVATLKKGISTEMAKKLQKIIRDQFPKVQARIQGDAVRVGSKSKDDLQKVMGFLREQQEDFPLPLQFVNYR
jgi:uncharacterized protein YajQ (UPF0234 family)